MSLSATGAAIGAPSRAFCEVLSSEAAARADGDESSGEEDTRRASNAAADAASDAAEVERRSMELVSPLRRSADAPVVPPDPLLLDVWNERFRYSSSGLGVND